MHDKNHEHPPVAAEETSQAIPGMEKLKKLAEHWIGHNEEHARSYRLWAIRAKDAGRIEPGEILEKIAREMLEQNRRLERVIFLLNAAGGSIDSPGEL
jgi:hypothetical protein